MGDFYQVCMVIPFVLQCVISSCITLKIGFYLALYQTAPKMQQKNTKFESTLSC